MTKKAVVYFYDDICCVDDTEILYDKKDQLANIVVAMLRATAEAKTAEAYDAATNNLILKYNVTRNGKVSKMRTSRRRQYREYPYRNHSRERASSLSSYQEG